MHPIAYYQAIEGKGTAPPRETSYHDISVKLFSASSNRMSCGLQTSMLRTILLNSNT
jgi:hypothetical protein